MAVVCCKDQHQIGDIVTVIERKDVHTTYVLNEDGTVRVE